MSSVYAPVVPRGSIEGINFALKNPNGVRGLVLLSGYYFPTARVDVVLQTPAHLPLAATFFVTLSCHCFRG